ncbi:hypothetical protein Hdeb2414_s0211g00834411 [Helianthus debilis subsp. tardiflorus]
MILFLSFKNTSLATFDPITIDPLVRQWVEFGISTIFFCNGSKWVLVCARAKYECVNYITSVIFLFGPFEKCESIVSLFVFMKEQVRQQGEYESLHRDLNIRYMGI